MTKNQQQTKVYRITFDEKLSENMFRFLICQLKDNITRFVDRLGEWTEEKEKIVTQKNYSQTLQVPRKNAPDWESLEEGQVYLSGNFKPVGHPIEYFIPDSETKRFMRIDDLEIIKQGLSSLYSDVLKGS